MSSSGMPQDKFIDNDVRHKIEESWKEKILKRPKQNENNEKYYVLSMFPYPSGSLHMGHVRVYAISDAISRFHRMNGKNVIHPMGWDAFGLPAENAAIERNIDPSEWTQKNITNMKEQLKRMGCDFDWQRELTTCDKNYYKWTQELFLKLYKKNLTYQNESYVNWDPIDKTVLADEQVDTNGRSWRSGAKVEKKLLKQWFIKTTLYAKSLYDGLDDPILKNWRDIIKIQKNWIGKCDGTTIDFELICDINEKPKKLTLWTDKPEFIEHIKFLAVSRDNFLSKVKINDFTNIQEKYLDANVINPFTGDVIPIYYSKNIKYPKMRDNYLGIPGVNESDAEFCDLVGIKYDKLDELTQEETVKQRHEVMEEAKMKNIGGHLVSSRLRDWLISRQRYWGTPIPIIHCDNCGAVPVPSDQLPVELPVMSSSNNKIPNLREATDWLKTKCPECGNDATREADTMDTFVDSSWYFMRYIDSNNDNEMFSVDKSFKYLPVDLYIGGKEHAALHLYYARFINHFLHSENLLPTREPFRQLLVQGMVMGKSYCDKESGKYLKQDEVELTDDNKYVNKNTGMPVLTNWEKMSKSKYNGVDPMEMFDEYGADTTRLIMLADVAPTSSRNWSNETFPGVFNWQNRLWMTIGTFLTLRNKMTKQDIDNISLRQDELKEDNEYLFESRNYYIKGVTSHLTMSQQFNAAISKMQGFTNAIRRKNKLLLTHSRDLERALATQIIMLAPIAPQFASELWAGFCSAPYHLANDDPFIQLDKDVLEQSWPALDMDYKMNVDIMISGNQIATLKIPRKILETLSADDVAKMATETPEFCDKIKNRTIDGFRYEKLPGFDGKIFFQSTDLNAKKKKAVL
ncbi:hypothetical protein HCN44_003777 [Aphidius gifuensis]|uniref:leucine--tRNA ligase n=1 Tax=Aphidius gifuensis TaxID=684658 RepID=A0A835CKL5_APHGI|nr:hypothetical protein HCN44_003777 [Aphidius gifuensis]